MKDIPEYEGFYKIDENGNVFSVPRNGTRANGLMLKRQTHKSGYQYYTLQKRGVLKSYLIHRLVAITFIDNPENKAEVNHIDGVKSNNCVSNLEWASRSENEIHAFRTGLKVHKADRSPSRKINSTVAALIRSSYKPGITTQTEIARHYKIDQSTVSYILSGKLW